MRRLPHAKNAMETPFPDPAALPDADVRDAFMVFPAALALLSHVQRHFADEEAILEELCYQDLPGHRHAHTGLVRRAGVLYDRVLSGEASLGSMVEFLAQDVVARHLIAVDRAFFRLFRVGSGPLYATHGPA